LDRRGEDPRIAARISAHAEPGAAAQAGGRRWRGARSRTQDRRSEAAMHYDAHQNVIDDLEARILTIRDSL
jgi:hypothetical protein